MSERTHRAVFLDRDGTIIEDADYLTEIEQIRILPGVPEALQRLREAGFLLLVVTNQSAVARGRLTEEKLTLIHAELNRRLEARGAGIDAFYHCPHLPEGIVERYACVCECRKPAAGLLVRAAREWGIDFSRSYAVGDSERDVEAGRKAGCFAILVGGRRSPLADAQCVDLPEASGLILDRKRR